MSDSILNNHRQAVDWQVPLESVPERLWDVVIIGAGPAGSSAAFYLGRKGYQVLLVDMARFPREKVCGDCMITDVEPNLSAMGLTNDVRQKGMELPGITIYSPSHHQFTIPGNLVTLRRPVLDSLLARKAAEVGVTFAAGQAVNVAVNSDNTVVVHFKGRELAIRGKIGIMATGAHIGLARKLGLVVTEKPSAVAMRCYVRSPNRLDSLIMCYEKNILPGYGWIVPLGDDQYNVGCGFYLSQGNHRNMRKCFDAYLASFPPARELLKGAEIISPPRSGAIRCGLRGAKPLYRRSIALVGETIGTTFPLTGEGIGQAMMAGAIAAGCIGDALATGDRNKLEQYPRLLEEKLRPRHEGFEYAQRWVSRAWLIDFLARRVKSSKYLQNACASFITNSEDPRKVYSLGAVLKSFWM